MYVTTAYEVFLFFNVDTQVLIKADNNNYITYSAFPRI